MLQKRKKFYEECIHDYEVMKETAKKHGIKNPILEIPMEVDFREIMQPPLTLKN